MHSATCVIAGPNGRREIPVEDFCVAPGRTVLQGNEFLVSLLLPAPHPDLAQPTSASFLAMKWTLPLSAPVPPWSWMRAAPRSSQRVIALGAVAPTPLYVKEAGDSLAGQPISSDAIEHAAQLAQAAAKPITDMRGTVEYRKHLSAVLTRRVLKIAIERAKAS